jgi:hypothetical protein
MEILLLDQHGWENQKSHQVSGLLISNSSFPIYIFGHLMFLDYQPTLLRYIQGLLILLDLDIQADKMDTLEAPMLSLGELQ